MIDQSLRFSPAVACVKGQLDAGHLGGPSLLRIHHWRPPREGEGWLLDELVRHIDLACWLFEASPDHVYAAGRPDGSPPRDCDYLQLHLGFPGGGMALIDACGSLPAGDSYFSLSLIGSAGAAYADDHHNMQLLYGGGPPQARITGSSQRAEALQQQANIAPSEDAQRVARVVSAAQASLQQQRAIGQSDMT